jgi:poly-gamma-glutamate synthesis protein (capsule biosynthesis protein)
MTAHLIYKFIFKLVVIFGFGRYPLNRDPDKCLSKDFKNIFDRMYRAYKISNPIIKPEKGSNLKAYFTEKLQHINQPLLPKEFQTKKSTTFSAVGDLMNAKGLENSIGKFYANVAELIFDADISIANLESTLTRGKVINTGFQINATPEQFEVLKGHNGKNYTVFCTANNHILDHGMEGFNTTHDQLENEGFLYVGTNRTSQDQKKNLIITKNDIKFGLVAATYSVNNNPFPNGQDYLVNIIPFHHFKGKVDLSLLEDQISYCKSENCDFIIVSIHWGMEFEFFPRKNQVDIAHHLIELGADAIISHHTHNIQPYEIYQTKRDPHRKAPIFYGLGNLSSLWSTPYFSLSIIANFDVTKGQIRDSEKTLISRINITPVLQMEYSSKKTPYLQIEKLKTLTKSTYEKTINEYINEASKYADLILGKSWRR